MPCIAARGEECTIERALNGALQVAIVEHDERFLPPISSCTRAWCDMAAVATRAPTLCEPVNEIAATSA